MNNTVYAKQIRKVLDCIDKNLHKSLSLKELAEIGMFSPYHFHRIIRAYLREPLMQYVKRLRIERAAGMLLLNQLDVSDIAMQLGFEEPSSLNKAFKKHFGVSPTQFKKDIRRRYHNNHIKKESMMKLTPEIKKVEEMHLIFREKMGEYHQSATKAWDELGAYAGPKGLMGQHTQFIGISKDDPNITETDKLRYQACITVPQGITGEGNIGYKSIAAGKYAVFMHKGPYNELQAIYNYIFGEWMQTSGEQLRDDEDFEKYLNAPGDVPEDELRTEIYIPLQ